jgi:hypothetical protein
MWKLWLCWMPAMIDTLPRSAGWLLVVVGVVCVAGGAFFALSASPVGWLVLVGSMLYLAVFFFMQRTRRISRGFVITTRLFLPAVVGWLLLESAAQPDPTLQTLSAGCAATVAGIYLVQTGNLRLAAITTRLS